MATDRCSIVAAINFGTTYSVYAYSFYRYMSKPLYTCIYTNQIWKDGIGKRLSIKTPTCLLLNAEQELEAFGIDAEHKYHDLVQDNKQSDYYYFQRFMMNLHYNKNISTTMTIKDINGKVLPAVVVFSKSIQALKNYFTDQLKDENTGFGGDDIFWVLTVPAIWTDKAKQFMKISAVEAGILEEKMTIASKREAASTYCQHLIGLTEIGTKYMVVNIGGHTVDIAVHEILPDEKLKEITCSTENDCGGNSVDGRYFQLLVKIFGGPLIKCLQQDDPFHYLDLIREIKYVKSYIETKKTGNINLTIPFVALDKLCKYYYSESLIDVINASSESNNISVLGDKLRIDAEIMKELFRPTINDIIKCIDGVLSSAEGVSKLLLVGGFAECKLVQEAIKEAFHGQQVIIPLDAGLVVVEGAVLFGQKQNHIQSLVMTSSNGVETF